LRLGGGSAFKRPITKLLFSGSASIRLMDDVDCIAQGIQNREAFVPLFHMGQAQD